jgi:hypothetical protein
VSLESLVVSDIRSFLLNGSLCYRPLTRLSFTFEACQISSDHRTALKDSLAAASKVPHADPQTEGFGFSLAKAVGKVIGEQVLVLTEAEAEAGRSINRLKFRHMAVETIYGYWLPATYAQYVQDKICMIEADSLTEMKYFAQKLNRTSLEQLYIELDSHIQGLKSFFATYSLKIEPKLDHKSRFSDFVGARKLWLADESRLERMVRRLHLEQMPDIWSDEEAAQKFENSFFEDLAMRFDKPGKSWIVSVLHEELELTHLPEPQSLKAALAKRLKRGFSDSIWWDEENEDEDEYEE